MIELAVLFTVLAVVPASRLWRRALDWRAAREVRRTAQAFERLHPEPSPSAGGAHFRVVDDRPLAPVVPLFRHESDPGRPLVRGQLSNVYGVTRPVARFDDVVRAAAPAPEPTPQPARPRRRGRRRQPPIGA